METMTKYALDPQESLAWSIDVSFSDLKADVGILTVEVPNSLSESAVMEAYERACHGVDSLTNDDEIDSEAILKWFLILVPGARRLVLKHEFP